MKYDYTINDKTYTQDWTEYDYGRMLSILNTYKDDSSIPWRFSGVDLSQTVVLSMEGLRKLYNAGMRHESKCSLTQYLVYYKILGLSDTSEFSIVDEFENDFVFVESNYDTAMESVVSEFNKASEKTSTEENINETSIEDKETVSDETVESTLS